MRKETMRSTRGRRSTGVLLSGIGVAASVLGLANPVAAADPPTTTVTSGQLDWAVSAYVGSSSSLAVRAAEAPAVDVAGPPKSWSFPTISTASYDPSTGATELTFAGAITFGNTAQGNYGFRLSGLEIEVDADDSGRVIADVQTRGPGPTPFGTAVADVTVADFTLADGAVTDDAGSVSWTVTPEYPLQADGTTFATPAFTGARQFPDSFLAAVGSGFYGHFSDSVNQATGQPSATNVNKPPAALTVAFDYEVAEETITSTTADSTTSTTAATSSTTGATTSTTAATTSTTQAPGGVDPSGSTTATGPNGQTLTVTPIQDLDPAGETVQVTGGGFDPTVGVYVALCVDNGPGTAPSPCVGGVDQTGQTNSSRWITNSPPAPGISTPFGAGGSFATTLDLVADDGTVDCLDPTIDCVVTTRADHTHPTDRTADVKVPVFFVGQTPPTGPATTTTTTPPATLSTRSVTAGGSITVSGEGFLAGEQVQVVLFSDPVVLGVVVADADGKVSTTKVIPAGTPAGTHHIELVGVTSGRKVVSPAFTVVAAAGTGGTGSTALPRTGTDASPLLRLGLLIATTGILLTIRSRRAQAVG